MEFNYGFDGLDFLPSLTFSGHQSLGNVNHRPFEDPLATPRQSVSLRTFSCMGVWGKCSLPTTEWVDVI